MSTDHILKDLSDIYSRLFDHRPSLQGEISYFIREFEDKRNNREYFRLQKSLEYSREIDEHLIKSTEIQLHEYLPHMQEQVTKAISSCEKVLSNQDKPERDDCLRERRQERVQQWSAFMDAMCEKSGAVDTQYNDEVRRVQNYYKELEAKLKLSQDSAEETA